MKGTTLRAVIQRVKSAKVVVDGQTVSAINQGVLTLLGVAKGDSLELMKKMIGKIVDLRIFEDSQGKMNLSLKDIGRDLSQGVGQATGGEHLIVSQFTLVGDCSQGRRPSFIQAEAPDLAKAIYDQAIKFSQEQGIPTQGGIFQANMQVEIVNDGPVTFVLDY